MADQSRRMSLVESVANVAIGYGIALLTQLAVFPAFGLHVSLEQNAAIGAIFTVVSIVVHCRIGSSETRGLFLV